MIGNRLYMEDVAAAAAAPLPWEKLRGKTLLITGATGLIGSFLTDVLMFRNYEYGLNVSVITVARNEEYARRCFAQYWDGPGFRFIAHDVNTQPGKEFPYADILMHLASETHPVAYATSPVQTITSNIIGTDHLLRFACETHAEKFLLASSVEVYGERRGGAERLAEDSCGYIDCNTLRAGYPESKRCAEALCQAYRHEKGIGVVIPRLTRSYGPTLLPNDSKALSQFLHSGLRGENIVLKSPGEQFYSFTYMADAVTGLLTVLLMGEDGAAYNISDTNSEIRLKELAALVAELSGTKVIYSPPGDTEKAGFSKAEDARPDPTRIRELGWQAQYDIRRGIARTLELLLEKQR